MPGVWWQEPVRREVAEDGLGPPGGFVNQAKQPLPAADLAQPPEPSTSLVSPLQAGPRLTCSRALRSIQGSEPPTWASANPPCLLLVARLGDKDVPRSAGMVGLCQRQVAIHERPACSWERLSSSAHPSSLWQCPS